MSDPKEIIESFVSAHMAGINMEVISSHNRSAIEAALLAIDEDVKQTPALARAVVRALWKGKRAFFEDILSHGPYSRASTYVALILAGHLIVDSTSTPPWASASLHDAKTKWHSNRGATPFMRALATQYSLLSSVPSLKAGIQAVLSRPQPPPISKQLQTLDISALELAYEKKLRLKPSKHQAGQAERQVKASVTTAPSSVKLSALRCLCHKTQESNDEIYTKIYLTRLINIAEVMNAIDVALKAGAPAVNLNCLYENIEWRSPVSTNIIAGDEIAYNHILGEHALNQGFGPWSASVILFEEDNGEYDTVTSLASQAAEYSFKFSAALGGGGLALSGIPPAFVLTEAAAGTSFLTGCAAEAVVGATWLANRLDEDDVIGRGDIMGRDYAGEAPHDQEIALRFTSPDGASYTMFMMESTTGTQQVQRWWRYVPNTYYGKEYGSDRFDTDGSHDRHVELAVGVGTQAIAKYDVRVTSKSGDAYARWVAPPVLSADRTKVVGTVHWGVDFDDYIHFRPWVECWSFTTPV